MSDYADNGLLTKRSARTHRRDCLVLVPPSSTDHEFLDITVSNFEPTLVWRTADGRREGVKWRKWTQRVSWWVYCSRRRRRPTSSLRMWHKMLSVAEMSLGRYRLYHGLYGSTCCCISHGPCQRERAIFDPPPSSETPGPIFMKLEICNYFPDTTPHAKFQGPMSTWEVWANRHFDAWKFLSCFSFLSHTHRSHIWTHPNAQYVIMRRSRQGSAFWG